MPATLEFSDFALKPRGRRDLWVMLLRNKIVVCACVVVAIYLAIAVAGTRITPYDPGKQDLRSTLQSPSSEHWLGTDQLGRDVFSRVLMGTRLSFAIGGGATALAAVLGVVLGLAAGYFGRAIDMIVSRTMEVLQGLPTLLLIIILLTTLSPGPMLVFLSLGLTSWVLFARLVRSQVLSLREAAFVESARAIGAPDSRIILTHIFPNVAPIAITLFALEIGPLILAEATISFLGAGVQPPDIAWGMMLAQGRDYMAIAWWVTFSPGAGLLGLVLSLSVIANWVRLKTDPKRRHR